MMDCFVVNINKNNGAMSPSKERIVMKTFIIAAVLAGFVVWPDAYAKTAKKAKEFFMTEANEILTKQEAARKLILFRGENVYRCQSVMLSDKLTIVRKK